MTCSTEQVLRVQISTSTHSSGSRPGPTVTGGARYIRDHSAPQPRSDASQIAYGQAGAKREEIGLRAENEEVVRGPSWGALGLVVSCFVFHKDMPIHVHTCAYMFPLLLLVPLSLWTVLLLCHDRHDFIYLYKTFGSQTRGNMLAEFVLQSVTSFHLYLTCGLVKQRV